MFSVLLKELTLLLLIMLKFNLVPYFLPTLEGFYKFG